MKTEAVSEHLENDDLFLSAPEVKFFLFWSTTRLGLEENSLSINRKLKLPLLQAISCQGIHTVFSFPSWKGLSWPLGQTLTICPERITTVQPSGEISLRAKTSHSSVALCRNQICVTHTLLSVF